ncbi:efflux RND transporter periplasmic adaptor subunit [Acidovorax sp. CCYZU-2555]|uniref:efflux RND transporter periplasmic adaptor subunit n=1 Tax=Acidovorax sp. CCYZU-2555 TaxID=2835042 RepID=UPI001BCEB013|nr:efflux RND transporter periplasmic adaptor subunit [Acidovorax sp. CCYZU-2555]MBS7776914.1 efflux RND transporter periplasmic adaptor subunit [Acidovorax sp. CCYZU-2555]
MPRRKVLLLVIAAALAVSVAVGRALIKRQHQQQAGQQAASAAPLPLRLSPGEVLTVQRRALPLGVHVSGVVEALQVASIKSYAAGTLQDLTLREGDSVQAGQVLARVDAADASARLRQAQQEAEAARAQQSIQQRLHSNNEALVAQGFISQTALRTSDANLQAARAQYQSALAQADVARKAVADTVLRSPIAGQVAQRLVNNGERVAVEAKVLEIVDLRQLQLQALLPPADSLQVRVGQQARLRLDGSAQDFAARVVRVSPRADAATRSVAVYLQLLPPSSTDTPVLRPGMFLQGQIDLESGAAQPPLALPLDAVLTDKPQPYVQLVLTTNGQQTIAHRAVTVGARALIDGQAWAAIEGVAEGSQVVASGAGALREGTVVEIAASASAPPPR